MKKRMFYSVMLFSFFSIILFSNCKKKEDDTKDTAETIPVLTTTAISVITPNTSKSGGNISSDGNSAVTSRGVCWSTSQNPTISDNKTSDGSGSGTFTSSITGLAESTTYYVRAYATNGIGTAYGNQVSFTTIIAAAGTVTDIDGNIYNTITIGTQVWTKENLRVTHYRNGDPITKVTDTNTWGALTTEAFCWYNNDAAANALIYGALYNWYAVSDPRNICPVGWHVPSDTEWSTLENNIGGIAVAGGKLKEVGTTHWSLPNIGATNETGFTALPSGYRYSSGIFDVLTFNGVFWTSTQENLYYSKYRYISYNNAEVTPASLHLRAGCSLRLVKD
jgi:uncharacterized protein (TIGR02145 family)